MSIEDSIPTAEEIFGPEPLEAEPDGIAMEIADQECAKLLASALLEEKPNAATAGKITTEIALSRIVTAQTILDTDYPEPKWAVKDLIPEGVTFVAGPPKLGKSIFCLNIAVAVSQGGPALSFFDVEEGSVLYLALEDGPRRIQSRLRKLVKGKVSDSLEVVNEWPRVNQGGLEAIDAWINSRKDARLLIVDTLKCIRPATTGHDNRNAYDADYEAIAPLTKLVSQRVALLIVHHTRKALAEDPLATVSGSYGLTGAADGVLVLARSRNKSNATLSVIGRDVEEQELALEFRPNLFLWSVLGKADEVRRSDERQDILNLLAPSKEPMAPGEIAAVLNKHPTSTRTLIHKMKHDGQVKSFGNKYHLPSYVPPEPEPKPKKSKSKKGENVPAFPGTDLTGNAPNPIEEKDLSAERSRVPTIRQVPDAPKGNGVHNTGNAGTHKSQPMFTQQLTAFPAKNVPGNAGTPDDYRAPWDNDEPLD